MLLAPGDEVTAPEAPTPEGARASGGRQFVSPNARRVAAERGIDVATIRGTGPGGRVVSEDVEAAVASRPAAAAAPRPV